MKTEQGRNVLMKDVGKGKKSGARQGLRNLIKEGEPGDKS